MAKSLLQQSERQFLSFLLAPTYQALLPAHQLSEIVSIAPNQVVAIAEMPAFVMGVYNWRGEVLWLVDLAALLGFPPLVVQERPRSNFSVMILHDQDKVVGLVVDQVTQMVWCDPAEIQSPPATSITPELVPYLWGYWLQAETTWLVLHGTAIIAALAPDEATG